MNRSALQRAQADFLATYPGGFAHPEMQALSKKHPVAKLTEQAHEAFAPKQFAQPREIVAAMSRLISRSSMVSMFEKPKFRDFAAGLSSDDTAALAGGLKQWLHGDQQAGFEQMCAVLESGRLAKWSLLTILPSSYHPDTEVFVKPTTAKGIIRHFELPGLQYRPQAQWDFYQRYRAQILQLREQVDPCLAPNNAAFCGFLMMSLPAS